MATGRRLADRYLLEQLVALGGMGAVWRGRDLRLDRPVAVKVMASDSPVDPTAVERFDREARTVARLTHPNIVAVYDFGNDGADSYLVMELVEGRTVAELGPLSVAQAVTIAAQTCDGLAAAHAAGVIHRDVKPANLILTPVGVIKICDFGIARLQYAVGQSRLTGSAVTMGSTRYMAPEQVLDQPVDERSDLYGLGCTIYAMLTGRPPFPGDNPIAVVEQHVTQAPPDVRSRRPDVPAALAELVNSLLAKAPADRPADARAVAARLAALFGKIAPAEPANPGLRLSAVPGAAAVAGLPTLTPALAPASASGSTGVSSDRAPGHSWQRTWALLAGALTIFAAMLLIPLLDSPARPPSSATTVPTSAAAPSARPSPTASSAAPSSANPTPSRIAAPPVAASTGPPVITLPNPTVPPTPSPAWPTPAPPADPIVSLRLTIEQQVTAGQLEPAAAAELDKKVDELAAKIDDRNGAEAAKKIKELRDKLTKFRRDGRLSQAGYDALTASLDSVAAIAPMPTPKPRP